MSNHVPRYYQTGGALPGQRTLVHVWNDGSITTMAYDEATPIGVAIEMMQQQERIYKHFGTDNAGNRKKVN